MAQVIGKVEKLEGKFYVQDENGNIKELKLGDEVRENEIIIGDDSNADLARVIIAINGSSDTIEILSNSQLKLDNTLLNQTPDSDLVSTTKESLNDALQSVETQKTQNNQNEETNETPVVKQTVTNQTSSESENEESLELDFVDRTGDEIDINSDLRVGNILKDGAIQAKFHGLQKGSNEDFGSFVARSGNETDINSDLRQTDNGNNDDRDENGTDEGIPPLYGIINLSGDIVVDEGATATYILSVDNAPRSDLFVTIEISHIDTNSGDLTISTQEIIITEGTNSVSFTIDNNDDLYTEGDEDYRVTLASTKEGGYTELTIANDEVITTIDDDALTTSKEIITIKLFAIDSSDGSRKALNEVKEGESPEYIAVAFDKDNNEISINETVEVTFGQIGDSATSNTDYNATTQTVTLGVKFDTNTIDDYISDNNESYKVQITDNSMTNSNIYETVNIDTTPVTTNILDNSQPSTPNNPADDTVEPNSEAVVVKLVPTDSLGNEIAPVTIGEGQTAYYKAILVDPDGNQIVGATGDVDITFTDDIAIRTGTTADGKLDFSATNQTVTLNVPFSADSLDDYIKDSGETFDVQIVDETYTEASTYETVTHDTTPVVTTIIDGASESDGGASTNDSVFLQLDTNDSVDEANAATLTHQFHLVDKDDNPINLAVGETITVTLAYSTDGTEAQDFSDKKTTVTITGNGGSDYSFDNTIVDDFLNEGDEVYTVAISSIDTNSTSFENIKIADTANGANSTVNSATGTIRDGVNDSTPNETDNDTVYAVLTGDTSVIEGNTANYTVQLLDIDGNPVTVSANTVVNVTFTNSTTQDADTEYSNNQVIPVTIIAGTSNIALDTDTIDDYMSDNGEDYTLTITSIPSHEFEAIDIDGFTDSGSTVHVATQTTVITDNTGTPNNDTTDENENSENPSSSLDIVEIKLIACDTSGTKLTDGSGNYILVNEIYEGDAPGYMAVAFVPGTTVFNASTETPTQDGTVAVTFTDATAQGVSTFTTKDGTQDFDNDGQTVTLGVAFYTDTFDDFTADDGQTFNVQITDGTYTPPTPTTGYENVNIDTTPVVTTIRDDISVGTADNAYVDEDSFDVTNSSLNLTGKEHTTSGGGLDVTGNGTTGNDTLLNIATNPSNYDDYTFTFDSAVTLNSDTQTNTSLSTSGIAQFQSGGVNIEYVVSGDTLTAYKGVGRTASDKVFDITLDKNAAGGADDGYTYTQYKNIDHPTTTGTDDDTLSLIFGYTITNDGETSDVFNFDVLVNDSLPSGTDQNLSVDEDNILTIVISDESFAGGNITLNNNVTGGDQVIANGGTLDIYDIEGDDVIGTITNNGDGTLTFTPDNHYSGDITAFSYITSDSDGDGASANIDITVNPIADNPIMPADIVVNTWEDANTTDATKTDGNQREGANVKVLGLTLPALASQTDQTDQNSATGSAANDAHERFGLLEISFSSNADFGTATIGYDTNGDGTLDGTLQTITNSSSFSIDITDVAEYHPTGTSGTYHLTQAQYESLAIVHEEDNNTDISMDIKTIMHEIDDSGASVDTSSTASQNVTLDIKAVTDPISLKFDSGIPSYIDEDNYTLALGSIAEDTASQIDLAALIADELLGDNDGSEDRSFELSGLPIGTIITLGGKKVIVADPTPGATSDPDERGTATIAFPDNTEANPAFTIDLPEHFSTDSNLTIPITLKVQDTDSDSVVTPDELTDTITLTITGPIAPVPDTVTLQVKQAIGEEDAGRSTGNIANDAGTATIDDALNGIDLDIKVTSDDTDGSETFTVTIAKMPENGSIYYNGTVYTVADASTTGLTDTNGNGNAWELTIANFDNDAPLKFIPAHNDDSDFVFDVSAASVDTNGTTTVSGVTQNLQIDVTVNEVSDIPVNDTLASTTVADDDTDNNSFTLTATEDSGTINLKTVLANPATLDSYDNSDSSETLTMKVTNLADGFDIQGATFLGGTGTSRVWFIDLADLQSDNITLTSPEHFAGEVNFDIAMVTTEDAGDSKTHDAQEVSLMITPVVDTTINILDTQNEDETITLDFGLNKPDSDASASGEETLTSFEIDVTGLEAAGITLVSNGIDLTTGKSGFQTVTVNSGVLEAVTATLTEDSHINGSYNFDIRYTIDDQAVDKDANTYTDSQTTTTNYTVTVSAITDDIDLTFDTSTVTVTDNTTFSKALNVAGLDTDGRGNADTDTSEQFTRVEVSGVPQGVTVVGGTYAGDTDNGTYSGFWYVDIIDQDIDGDDAQYNLEFNVDGAPADGNYNITITAFNEDNSNGVEQDDSESFTLTVLTDGSWDGQTIGTPATITSFTQDIDTDNTADHANAGMTDADAFEGSVLREDTQFSLGSVVDVATTGTSTFSITLKNVPVNVTIDGMIKNGDYYTVSGTGNQTSIEAVLNSILITPNADENTNAGDISNTDLAFDIELTTYATGGAQDTALINFTGSVLPVTDAMDLTVVNDGTTQEDTTQAFSITLDNTADGSNFTIVDGTVYLQLTENFGDIQGTDGTAGVLIYEGTIINTQAVSGVSGISDGNYYVITGVSPDDILNFTYEPAEDRNGSVDIDVFVKNIESETWNPFNTTEMTSTKTISFDVTAVEDGFTSAPVVTATGTEDNLVEVSVTATNPDSSELLASVSLDGVPDGFLIVYGPNSGSTTVAQNIGDNGTFDDTNDTTKNATGFDIGNGEYVGYNLWNIPLTSGEMPAYIGIKAPENWSGEIPNIVFNTTSETGVSTQVTFTADIDPVADNLTLNATPTFGQAGEDIELKLNANVDDLDGSETVTLTLTGLGSGALFKANGVAVDSANVDYTGDTYTITNIAALDLNKLTVVQSQLSTTTINITAVTVETDGGATSTPTVNDSFDITISESIASSGDDTLLYVGASINGLDGNDALVLAGASLTFDDVDNIETLDLGAGDNTISGLSLDDVLNMTDTNNTLNIIGDTNDDVQAVDTTGWSKDSETDNGDSVTYEYSKGADTVTLTVDDNVNNTGL